MSTDSNNTDGTKNKSLTILATASTEPYICVATDIPGPGRIGRNSSVLLTALLVQSTTADTTTVGTSTRRVIYGDDNLSE